MEPTPIPPPSPPIASAKEGTPDVTANWKIVSAAKCGFSIKLPDGWSTADKTTPDMTTSQSSGCIVINAPDYNPNKEIDFGLQIAIDRTEAGSIFKNVPINDPDGYIAAARKTIEIQPPTDIISNIKSKTVGSYSGKYFELSAMITNSYFVFKNDYAVYSARWPQSYPSNYLSNVDQILSTFKFIDTTASELDNVRNFVDIFAQAYVDADWSTLKTLLTVAMAKQMTENEINLPQGKYLSGYHILSIVQNTNPDGYKATIEFLLNGKPIKNPTGNPSILIVKENGEWKSLSWYLFQ